jgi:superfamily II DNA/RNA helicase
VEQHVIYVRDDEKKEHVKRQLTLVEGLTLIFVETKRGADALETWLYMQGFNATSIHGDRSQFEREAALKAFKSGQSPVMVATDVAARGLDIPAVSHVINYDSASPPLFFNLVYPNVGLFDFVSVPNDIDDYVHRIGRTGRAGNVVRASFSITLSPTSSSFHPHYTQPRCAHRHRLVAIVFLPALIFFCEGPCHCIHQREERQRRPAVVRHARRIRQRSP